MLRIMRMTRDMRILVVPRFRHFASVTNALTIEDQEGHAGNVRSAVFRESLEM